jgi:hypothetical protein
LSWRTVDDQTRGFHSATLEVAPERAQDSPRRSARSEIRQDDQQLHDTAHHTAIRSLELCDTIVNRLPLAYKRRRRSPGRRGTTNSRVLTHFPPSPRYWHSASIKPQGPGGLTSSPATLVAPLCKHNNATQYNTLSAPLLDVRPTAGTRIKPVSSCCLAPAIER